MKLTIFALIAALCLAVAVNVDAAPNQNAVDFEYHPTDLAEDEFVEVAEFGILYFSFTAALRTLKGLNCSIKGALNIKAAGEKFLRDVNACGGEVSKQLQKVIDAVQKVINTTKDIITINDESCKSNDANAETDGNKKVPYFKCFLKMLSKMWTVKKQTGYVISLIKKVPTAGTEAGVCVKNALNGLESSFTQFPGWVKECSRLTSN